MNNNITFVTGWFLMACILILSGCTEEAPNIPKTESETLNALLESAPNSIVPVVELPVDTFYAEPDHVMADSSVDSLSPSGRLGRVAGLIKIGDSLYVADGQQNCIWVIDQKGTICRKIGRSGHGPGEYGDLGGLMKNRKHVFTADISNSRIQKFDQKINLQTTFNHVVYGNAFTTDKLMSATDSLLYLSTGAMSQTEDLISFYQTAPSFDSLGTFHPRLIPGGMQPGAYNNYSMDTNSRGEVAVSYTGLPYIFLYDSAHQLQHAIYVRFPEKDLPDNPPVKPVDKPARTASEAIGVKWLIGQVNLTGDGDLYFSHGSKLYHLSYHSGDNEYQAEWVKFFTYSDPKIREERPYGIHVSSFIIDQDESQVYFGSIFEEHIYQFYLE
ncbi:6-bladed beta-propeller [Aliifodinibius salicampi]|uniref:6-bladed beta-propeller n=1 Tax=Fodinibius salicampi TaxID=1920655 RepID=A0ABT3PWP6_9BACT|nr:6-bladed beta-propeller [Fodinibius salicampi]MCW9712263.1 6-bladed beta-propeller [Fodinibius salicampi]